MYNVNGLIADGPGQGFLVGPVEQWVEELTGLAVEGGMDTFVFFPWGPVGRQLPRFAEEVVPAVRSVSPARGALVRRPRADRLLTCGAGRRTADGNTINVVTVVTIKDLTKCGEGVDMKTSRRAAAPVVGVLAGAVATGLLLGGNATATESDVPGDRFAIREVIDRHQMYIDLRDADGYANLYAKDGRYRSPFGSADGRSEIKAMFIDLAEKGFTKGKRHMSGPAMIEVNGTTATARSWYWVAETEKEHAVYATGTYTDKLRKVNGKWEIVQRTQTLDELAPDSQ